MIIIVIIYYILFLKIKRCRLSVLRSIEMVLCANILNFKIGFTLKQISLKAIYLNL